MCYNVCMRDLSIKKIFSVAWDIYKAHFLSISLIYLAIVSLLYFIRQVASQEFLVPASYSWFLSVSIFLVQIFIALGIIYMALKIDHSRAPSWRDFSAKIDRVISFAVLILILSFFFYLGLYFFLSPALLFLSLFAFSPYIFVDKSFGPLKSLYYSFEISKGHILSLSFFWVLIFAINAIASLTVVGLLVSLPFSSIAVARAYDAAECLRKDTEGCQDYFTGYSRQAKILIVFLIFIISFYGAMLFFKRLDKMQYIYVQNLNLIKNINQDNSAKYKKEFEKIVLALELYKDFNGKYPETLFDLADSAILDADFDLNHWIYKLEPEGYSLCSTDKSVCN